MNPWPVPELIRHAKNRGPITLHDGQTATLIGVRIRPGDNRPMGQARVEYPGGRRYTIRCDQIVSLEVAS